MRRFISAALALTLLLAACTDLRGQTPPVVDSTPTGILSSTPIPHAPEIRFALIGQPSDVNVWALFSDKGASYPNYALMKDYWPRLYFLAPPDFTFTPRSANGPPTLITHEGDAFTSTVTLRPDLKWTDGSPFTAEDVAFTVNSALAFDLNFEWRESYSTTYLVRAEAVDALTVKFYFKSQPNVEAWQYGVLQGPIVQKKYWEPRLAEPSSLLPNTLLRTQIESTRARIAELQSIVDSLSKQGNSVARQLKENQGNLNEANNNLAKYLDEYNAQMKAAWDALYALDHAAEPTLGVWMPGGNESGDWVNLANPDSPFEKPNFDRAVYIPFETEEEAVKAFDIGLVDEILFPRANVQSPSATQQNLNGSAHFLILKQFNGALSDPSVRKAIACLIQNPEDKEIEPLAGFILPGNETWRNPEAVINCADAAAVPSNLPSIRLLATTAEDDPLQAQDAARIESKLKEAGVSVTVEYLSPLDIRYRIFSTGDYDMAILGWKLSLYPEYLCDWFGVQGPFNYDEASLESECEALKLESDLDAAQKHFFTIQSILIRDLPFIPLYAGVTNEYSRVNYPFTNLLGGLSGWYGAPSFAMPSQ